MTVDTPLWLLALPLVAVVWWLGRRDRAPGPGVSRWDVATAMRALSVAALILALAGPRMAVPGGGVDTVFLVDSSDSVGGSRQVAEEWVAEASAEVGGGDRAAVALLGRRPQVAHGLRTDPPNTRPAVEVDGSATDLAAGLRLAGGVAGGERRRRVVLLSDGRETQGDALAAAAELADLGIALDVVEVPGAADGDLLVDEVRSPASVRDGEAYDVTVVVRNTGEDEASGRLRLLADGREVDARDVVAAPGSSEVTFPREADDPGTVRYEARLDSAASSEIANDVGRAAVRVDGPPRVLVYERASGLSDDLVAALESAQIGVDVAASDERALPGLDRLLDYDSVVLVDVPADVLGEGGQAALDAFVRDAGHGLVAVAGEESFGMGDYAGTDLEELLPVHARVSDPQRRPPVAEALVVDTSGSMAACHCVPEEAGGPQLREEGGVNKTDIAREAVARAVRMLDGQDEVGVLAFNSTSEWVVPLQQLPSSDIVDEGLARLHPEGNTDVPQAVREAISALRDTEARLRHIVLFTDGFTENRSLIEVAEEAAAEGMTLSVVGTGEGGEETTRLLRDMAEAGGGRFYPGRNLAEIPDLLAMEVQLGARPIVNEGRFLPVVTAGVPATDGLDEAPPLRGFLASTSKDTATTALRIGEERDPLLASWQAGLGRATAWMSDVAPRWSAEWVAWDEFADFWSDVVRDTFPADGAEGESVGTLDAVAGGDGLRVSLSLAETAAPSADGTVTVTTPSGERLRAELERDGLDEFGAVLGAADGVTGEEGVYAVSVELRDGETVLYRGTATVIRSYSAEYAAVGGDPDLLADAAELTGGRVNPSPEEAFDRAGLALGAARVPLWPWLAALALILAVADVGVRRLRLEREDWERFRQWLRSRLRRGGRGDPGSDETPRRDAATGSLLDAKARARGRADGQDGRQTQ